MKNRFLTFEKFNESIEDIFRSAHAAVDKKNLQPLKQNIGKANFPSQAEVDKAVEFLGIDPEYLYANPGDILNPIVYWKGPIFYGFFGGLNFEALKMMQVDKYFEQKHKYVEDALSAKNFDKLFARVDKKILIPTFIEFYKEIPDDQKYNVFIDLYMRSEFGFEMFPKEILADCFEKRTLSADWKKRIAALKKKFKGETEITVYRGQGSKSTKDGMSWTLDKKTAQFFANRFGQKGKILEKKVKVAEILDYLTDRSEAEVLLKNF